MLGTGTSTHVLGPFGVAYSKAPCFGNQSKFCASDTERELSPKNYDATRGVRLIDKESIDLFMESLQEVI